MEGSGQLHISATLLPRKESPLSIRPGGSVAYRAALDAMKRDEECLWPLVGKRPARSQVTAHTELSHFHKSAHIYSNTESVCSESYLHAI